MPLTHQMTAYVCRTHKLFYGTKPPTSSVMSPDNLEKCESQMQPNKAYETHCHQIVPLQARNTIPCGGVSRL